MTMELGGRVTIECEKTSFQAELEFKLKVALAAVPSATRGPRGEGARTREEPPPRPGVASGAGALRRGGSSWHLRSIGRTQREEGAPAGPRAEPGQAQTPSPPWGAQAP